MQLSAITDKDFFSQHTLRGSFTFIGNGIHSGTKVVMTVMPAEPNSGFTFTRRDVSPDKAEIDGTWNCVIDTHLGTTLGNTMGVRVSSVEHILSALYACGIDNAQIVLDAAEVPIMDGSAAPYVSVIKQVGRLKQDAPRQAILIQKPVSIRFGEKQAGFFPAKMSSFDIEIFFDNPLIGCQRLALPFDPQTYDKSLASARTFGFMDQAALLRESGFARGANLNNVLTIEDGKPLNEGGLRFADEFVRHKMLDAIGDVALMGAYVVGKFKASCSGHYINNALIRELMLNGDCWRYASLQDISDDWLKLVNTPLDDEECENAS